MTKRTKRKVWRATKKCLRAASHATFDVIFCSTPLRNTKGSKSLYILAVFVIVIYMSIIF